jgi:hypothetical protein
MRQTGVALSTVQQALPAGRSNYSLSADDSYIREIRKWRQQEDEFMRSPKSPLLLIGRFKIEEGESTLGSKPGSKIVLPERAPERVCTIVRHGREISLLAAAETTLAVNDKPASGLICLRTSGSPAPADRVGFGDFTFAIRPIGQDFYLLLIDRQSKSLQDFKGETWFSIDPAYRVTAHLVPYEHPKTRAVADTTGSMRTYTAPGYLVFQLGGQTLRLEPLASGDRLLGMFHDKLPEKRRTEVAAFWKPRHPKGDKPYSTSIKLTILIARSIHTPRALCLLKRIGCRCACPPARLTRRTTDWGSPIACRSGAARLSGGTVVGLLAALDRSAQTSRFANILRVQRAALALHVFPGLQAPAIIR